LRREYQAGVFFQRPPRLQWIAVKPPRIHALRCEQIEYVPGEFVSLTEWNQCHSLGRMEAKDIDGLQFIDRLFKSDDSYGPPDQSLSIGSAREGVQPLDLPPD
jgi:hypothetical protein